jgi:hypothetical protein
MMPSTGATTVVRPRLLRVAPLPGPGGGQLGTQGVALGEAVVGTVLRDEALGDEALLAFGEAFGLGHEGFEAG